MKEIVEKAIEGGFSPYKDLSGGIDDEVTWISGNNFFNPGHKEGYGDLVFTYEDIFLNKRFWEALGRRLKWHPMLMHEMPSIHINVEKNEDGIPLAHWASKEVLVEGWVYHWHKFIDHLAEGKPKESFFGLIDTTIDQK